MTFQLKKEKLTPLEEIPKTALDYFNGKVLKDIEYLYIPSDEYPNNYLFYFHGRDGSIICHRHALKKGVKLHPNNYNYIGESVSSCVHLHDPIDSLNKLIFHFQHGKSIVFSYN